MANYRFDYIKDLVITFDEFKVLKGYKSMSTGPFQEYWDLYLGPKYNEEYLKIINKNKTLTFLLEKSFETMDFDIIYNYMKSKNWFWASHNESPTIEQLKDGITSLLIASVDDDGSILNECGWSSGGFEVKLKLNNQLPIELKIIFKDDDTNFKVEHVTDLKELRKSKLKFLETYE